MKLSPAEWATIITAALGAGGTVSVAISQIEKIYRTWKNNSSARAIQNIAQTIDTMQDLAMETGAGRVLLLQVSNGGGIPSSGANLYVSILHEIKDRSLRPIKPDFQSMLTDAGYIRLLEKLVSNGEYHGTPDDLSDGFLKDLYVSEGVEFFTAVEVKRTKHKFYFLSLRWYPADSYKNHANISLNVSIARNKIARAIV